LLRTAPQNINGTMAHFSACVTAICSIPNKYKQFRIRNRRFILIAPIVEAEKTAIICVEGT
jgi:hypothetical protein